MTATEKVKVWIEFVIDVLRAVVRLLTNLDESQALIA